MEIIKQIGNSGSDANTYLVKKNGKEYAMKKFNSKKISEINIEAQFQNIGYKIGVSPRVYQVGNDYILMDKLNINVIDILKRTKGKLSDNIQLQIIKILEKLDEAGIFHNDPNPCNFMLDNKGKLYIIDYGYSKLKDGNFIEIMLIGFILRVKELFKEYNVEIKFNKFEIYLLKNQK